ncbi:hypothetical protein GA0070606_3222 [Micromonospora citrea]|uniref:Photosynthesis system II assembly factor Ycf48/Hcf136-like domain-containing protein n=1 Tax=Micromonospora citrea TaxID=47855 RepID=A0A1C6V1E9_9ACTN|nr:hypothetical protein [Micromonospora citrea]SCL60131.1 hypothetical protein GA0070606_3222 [Micromonospora citrea]
MRETALDEMFAEFEADTMTTFRPPGVPAAQRRVRERRRRRGLLAGAIALLLAGPGGAYAVAGRGGEPTPPTPPTPTPTVSPPPTTTLPERRAALPGVPGRLADLHFVDARNGWALFDTCESNDPGATGCRRAVGRTTDGGATWRQAAAIDAPTGGAHLLPVDERTLTVAVDDSFLVTTDGGATWSRHPASSPPRAAQAGVATRSGFLVRCPGSSGLDDGARGTTCRQAELARIGSGPVRPQPPVALTSETHSQLVEGGDGRLWLTVRDGDRFTVLVGTNGAANWRKLPAVPGAARLLVSPDGNDAWLVTVAEGEFDATAPGKVWQRVENRWERRPDLPDDTNDVAAANGGVLAVTGAHGSVGFWSDGRYVDPPELHAAVRAGMTAGTGGSPWVDVLRDGTVVVGIGTVRIVGVGSGTVRTWTRIS